MSSDYRDYFIDGPGRDPHDPNYYRGGRRRDGLRVIVTVALTKAQKEKLQANGGVILLRRFVDSLPDVPKPEIKETAEA